MQRPQNKSNLALGSGLEFPIRMTHRGGLNVIAGEEKIRQSILTILSTAKGERVMRPDFGCDLHAFVFAAPQSATFTLIKSAVREALVRWEPRIAVESVDAVRWQPGAGGPQSGQIPSSVREGQLIITVTYTIR